LKKILSVNPKRDGMAYAFVIRIGFENKIARYSGPEQLAIIKPQFLIICKSISSDLNSEEE
jgi:hypothetical protein